MIWLTWRQHRAEALALALVVAAIVITVVILGWPMHLLFPAGTADCAVPPLGQACRAALVQLERDYGYATPMTILFNLVPFAIGGFLGAPLVARELEAGTWQLAWTQAVPRMRWAAVKVSALGGLTAVLAAVFAGTVSWYRQPLDLLGRFGVNGFDVSGIVPVGYALFAFALAAVAGTLLRRSLPALSAALVAFVIVRLGVVIWLRPHYQTPIILDQAVGPGSSDVGSSLVGAQGWTLDHGLTDSTGQPLSELQGTILEHKTLDEGGDLSALGIHRWALYHPVDRFWTFQLIEFAVFTGLAAALLAMVIWRVRRRAG